MKRGSTVFLKIVIVLVALGVLAAMLWFPQTEGRAANLDLIAIYRDPFILYLYIGSIPFFVGLYQVFTFLRLIDANQAFSRGAVNTLRNTKVAALSLIAVIAAALLYIRFFAHGDDAAGPTALGVLVSFTAAVIATAAAVFQKLLQNAVDLQAEHELTV